MSASPPAPSSRDLLLAGLAGATVAYDAEVTPLALAAAGMPLCLQGMLPVALLGERCWVLRDTTARVAVIAFRGSDSLGDLFAGLDMAQEPLYKHIGIGLVPSDVTVHRGFMQYYNGVRQQLHDLLETVLSPDYTLVFTGHSLGSAAATVAALEYKLIWPQYDRHVLCATFGSPPLGNAKFVAHFNLAIRRSYRFVCGADITPRLPIPNTRHVKGRVQLPCRLLAPTDVLMGHHNMHAYGARLRGRCERAAGRASLVRTPHTAALGAAINSSAVCARSGTRGRRCQ